jgi:xanthosine utilization system XapX-like protein
MASSVYKNNKGINRPIEFKGLKAQYIWYLGGGLVVLLVLFALLYIIGVNPFVCVALIGILGASLFNWVYTISNKYGEHGMMKKVARRGIPAVVKSYSRKAFCKKLN